MDHIFSTCMVLSILLTTFLFFFIKRSFSSPQFNYEYTNNRNINGKTNENGQTSNSTKWWKLDKLYDYNNYVQSNRTYDFDEKYYRYKCPILIKEYNKSTINGNKTYYFSDYKNKKNDDSNYSIFTAAYTSPLNDMTVFLKSLSNTGYKGSLFIFTEINPNKDKIELIHKYGGQLLYCKDTFPFYYPENGLYPISLDFIRKKVPITNRKYPVVIFRYFLVYLFISKYGSSYHYNLLIDMKDVFFQINPFYFNYPDQLLFVEECRSLSIGGSIPNTIWMNSMVGNDHQLSDRYIINGGSFFFPHHSGIYFLELFINYIIEHINSNINDQALVNYFIYKNYITKYPFKVSMNYFGPVRTLQIEYYTRLECISRVNPELQNNLSTFYKFINGKLLNEDNTMPVLVHQYNRDKLLKKYIDDLYSE